MAVAQAAQVETRDEPPSPDEIAQADAVLTHAPRAPHKPQHSSRLDEVVRRGLGGSVQEIISVKAAADWAGVSYHTYRRGYLRGEYPAPIQISRARIGVLVSELEAWKRRKMDERDAALASGERITLAHGRALEKTRRSSSAALTATDPIVDRLAEREADRLSKLPKP